VIVKARSRGSARCGDLGCTGPEDRCETLMGCMINAAHYTTAM
jgi:hypothetical protein